jgi:hypothetical protein
MDPVRMLPGFPAPWSVVETTGEFIVKDASGRPLAYFYWWGGTTALLTRDEARCLANKFANMPSLMARGREGGNTAPRTLPAGSISTPGAAPPIPEGADSRQREERKRP